MKDPVKAVSGRRPIRRRVARGAAAVLGSAGLMVALGATPALAAGNPYSGPPVLPNGGVPGNFRSVLAAFTAPKSGRTLLLKTDGVHFLVTIPKGAAPHGEQVVITKGNATPIKGSELKNVPKDVAHDHAIFAAAALLQLNQKPVQNKKFVTVVVTGKQFKRGDYVVVYSPAAHGFVPAPKGHAAVVNGKLIVRFLAGTEFAVLAP